MALAVPRHRTTSTTHRATLRDVLLLARPWFWPVSFVPYYVGFVLATHQLVPTADQLPEVAASTFVVGPALWLAVLAVNDAYDVEGDRHNPRKRNAPVAAGRLTPVAARRIASAASVVAVAVALTVNASFALGTLAALAIGWAYSAPPIRLKTRPGADVVVNAVSIGALGLLAGWVPLRPVAEFPWVMAVLGTLVGVALYLPTTVADADADRSGGYRTIAVWLGVRRAYLLGLAAFVAAAVMCVVLAAADEVIPRRMLVLEAVMVPLLIAAYRRFVVSERSFRGIVIVATLFLIPSGTFVLTYTGVW